MHPHDDIYTEVARRIRELRVEFGGSGVLNGSDSHSIEGNRHGRPFHIKVTLPPLGVIAFRLLRQ